MIQRPKLDNSGQVAAVNAAPLRTTLTRRAALKLAGRTLAVGVLAPPTFAARRPAKKIIVGGAGIAGLCCAYELMQRGHDVTVLEASSRAGGHILTGHFADGLYADLGAEQCTVPGYDLYRGYVEQFGLTLLPYRRRDNLLTYINKKRYTDDMLADPRVLATFGLNQREVDFLTRHAWQDLELLYFDPYLDGFPDEYQPFGVGHDELDHISASDFLKREGASAAALRLAGRANVSALYEMWSLAGRKLRGSAERPKNLFRIQGGNQRLTEAFAAKLGARVRLECPITRIAHGASGVTIHHRDRGQEKKLEAHYFVNAIALPKLRDIPVAPGWPETRQWIFQNVGYNMHTRVVFQCRTRFWKQEGISPNISPNHHALHHVWECADEVPSERGILMGAAAAGTTAEQALEAFRAHYPGKAIDIEQAYVKDWYREAWAPLCERTAFPLGQLAKFWPHIIQPHGRIHFVGAYADNSSWGMEAATRSAHRVAGQIDRA